jgi:hypothetical protein
MRRIVLLLLLVLMPPSLFAQSVQFGFKLGARIIGEASEVTTSETLPTFQQAMRFAGESGRFTFGPFVEFSLRANTSIEVGVLYRSVEFLETIHTWDSSAATTDPYRFDLSVTQRTSARSLEFPALLRYHFPERKLRPFVAGGYVYRQLFDAATVLLPDRLELPFGQPHLKNRSAQGFVGAGRMELKKAFLRFTPEIRYTRWDDQVTPVSTLNQVDVLFGIGLMR